MSRPSRMSAFGYKRTYSGQLANVRFTPNSGHSDCPILIFVFFQIEPGPGDATPNFGKTPIFSCGNLEGGGKSEGPHPRTWPPAAKQIVNDDTYHRFLGQTAAQRTQSLMRRRATERPMVATVE